MTTKYARAIDIPPSRLELVTPVICRHPNGQVNWKSLAATTSPRRIRREDWTKDLESMRNAAHKAAQHHRRRATVTTDDAGDLVVAWLAED